jgi:hypothetical protein
MLQQTNFTRVNNVKNARPQITFIELRSILEKNKYKDNSLKKQAIDISNNIIEEITNVPIPDYYHLHDINMKISNSDIFEAKTFVEIILMLKNEEYSTMQQSFKDKQFQDKSLDLQKRIDTELKGTSYARQRKRLLESFGSDGGGVPLSIINKDPLIADVLSYLEELQFIMFQHENDVHTVSFIPSDPRNWSHDKYTYIIDCNNIGYTGISVNIPFKIMSNYMQYLELSDPVCIINWPSADGTKEELVETLSSYNNGTIDIIKKEKKDVLAMKVGRHMTIKHFTSWKKEVMYDDI